MVLYDVCVQACAVNYGGESMEVEERDNCVFMLACGLVVACDVFKNLFGACVFSVVAGYCFSSEYVDS